MKYRESQKDKKLRAWFAGDIAHSLLRRIKLQKGELRGLNSLDMAFEYPITAIAGRNGAGKSTILALACCAFHANLASFKLPRRKTAYYTFSDFFIQHSSEVPPQGLEILYWIAHDKWKPTPVLPTGSGVGMQRRKKQKGGKWNDYAARVRRVVIFLGIERIVPHSERGPSRSYSRVFKDSVPKGWEKKVTEAVGYILGKKYDEFRFTEHSKYTLPVVRCGSTVYSGLNMGAGENALFEIFSTICAAGPGALLVMDEIELGLHAEAQRRLVEKLKDVCLESRIQVICTTHSKEVFDCLPPDARFFVESVASKTRVTQGVSSEFAFSKLSAAPSDEVQVFVEDNVARAILLAAVPAAVRTRISVKVIGSAASISRQLAASYVRGEESVRAVFDGDQVALMNENFNHAKAMTEKSKPEFEQWFEGRVICLPGATWPEAWLLQKSIELVDDLAVSMGCDQDHLREYIEYGLQAGKHNEFHEISRYVGLEAWQCLECCAAAVALKLPAELQPIREFIEQALV